MAIEPNRNVYVGHRYVPKIMGEWDISQKYEGLSIVLHEGTSYTSKGYVPVGVDIHDEDYWAVTGNYNVQVEHYRQDVAGVKETLTEKADISFVNTELDKKADTSFVNTELEKKAELDSLNEVSYITPINTFSNVADGINNFYQGLPEDSTISFPRGDIEIDKPIIFDRKIHIDTTGVNFIYSGDDTTPAITIGSEGYDIRGIVVNEISVEKKEGLSLRLNPDEIGIRIINIRYSKIGFSSHRFYNNVVIDSMNSKGNVYNHYFVGHVYDGYNNLVIRTSDATSWSNENNFYGGSLAFSTSASHDDLSNLVVEHNGYRNNNNRFYGVSFEDAGKLAYAFKLDGGSHYFYGCRYEGSTKMHLEENAIDNVVMHGFGVPNSRSSVTGKITGLTIIGNRGQIINISSGQSFILDEQASFSNKTFAVHNQGNETFSVTGGGDISGKSLKIDNTINYSNQRKIIMGRGLPENEVVANVGSVYIEDTGEGIFYKTNGNDVSYGWRKIMLE